MDTSARLQQRHADAWRALERYVAALRVRVPADSDPSGEYAVALGEALACHDEMRVLRALLCQGKPGIDPAEMIPARDRSRVMAILADAKKAMPGCCGIPGEGKGAVSTFQAVRTTLPGSTPRDSQLIAALRRKEEALKNAFLRLMPRKKAQPLGPGERLELEVVPRKEREMAWFEEAAAWEEKEPEREAVFSELVLTRQKLAWEHGCESYAELLCARREEAQWIPRGFLETMASAAESVLKTLQEKRAAALGVTRLRPFDTSTQRLVGIWSEIRWRAGMEALMHSLDPAFSKAFRSMAGQGLLEGVEPGRELCLHLRHSRLPFLRVCRQIAPKPLMNAVHEIGHGIHILLAREQSVPSHRNVSPLAGELAALSIEAMAGCRLEAFFKNEALAVWCRRKHLEAALAVFPTSLTVTRFEERLYARDVSPQDWGEVFVTLYREQAGSLDYSGVEDILKSWYLRISVLVFSPGYFHNYPVAQAGALRVLAQFEEERTVPRNFVGFMRQGAALPSDQLYVKAGAWPAGTGERFRALGAELDELYSRAPLPGSDAGYS